MKVDFIIVGQGLAGSLLAFELLRLNKTLIVFDDPHQPSASSVAAGIINPVVFRRMTKSWMVDSIFPQMETTYQQLEKLLNEKIYHPSTILKILNEETVGTWKEKVILNQLEKYLEIEPFLNFRHQNIQSPYGAGLVTNAGRVDIHKLTTSFSRFLEQQNLLRKEKFLFEKLIINPKGVIYNDVTAEKILFCEGPSASQNPWFRDLKFKHSKGEILEVRIPDLHLNDILSQEVFVMPQGDDLYKVGATYSWDDLNWESTPEAREEMLTKMKSLISAPIEVIDQKAGVRPTMHDRKPVVGFLPEYPTISIFNGLGSKGALLGPFFARQLAETIAGRSITIHPEVNIDRFFRKGI